MSFPPMPEFRDGYITLWRDNKWVSVPLADLPKIIEEDNGTAKETELPSGA